MITIVDYGLGNLGSIKNMIKKAGGLSEITDDLLKIEQAKKLILPGVGSFDDGMSNLKQKELLSLLNKKVLDDKVPILGICLGMQLMTKKSEEGILPGLGWIDGQVKKFTNSANGEKLRIPHMGWNIITPTPHASKSIFENEFDELRFYFVHSYYVSLENESDAAAHSNYGNIFVSAFKRDNIMGMQFHPEKSHKFGMRILKNFINL